MRKSIRNIVFTSIAGTLKVLAALLFIGISLQLPAQTASSREYSIKAVFLFNFTQFVEWPSTAFSSADAPFIIGILGNNPFGSALDEAVSNEKVKGHPIVVQRYQTVKDIKSCHILFIGSNENTKVKDVLTALPNKNILTVSDIADFAKTGGMIRFMTEANKIRLQINPAASKAADLNISSKLLRVAEVVEPG